MAQEIHSQIQERKKQSNITDNNNNNNNTMEVESQAMFFSNRNNSHHNYYATNNNNSINNYHHDHIMEFKSSLSDNDKLTTATLPNENEFQSFDILSYLTTDQELNKGTIPTMGTQNNISSNNSGGSGSGISSNNNNSLNNHHQPSLYKGVATRPTASSSSTIVKLNKGISPTSARQESTLISASESNDSVFNNNYNNNNNNNLSTNFEQLTLQQPYKYNLPITTTQYTTNNSNNNMNVNMNMNKYEASTMNDNNFTTILNNNNNNNSCNNSDLMKIWEKIQHQDNNEQLSRDIILLNDQLRQVKQKYSSISLKCQLCYSTEVQCALVPCYHCIYCIDCAYKLSDCAICRKPVQTIQKIFLG
ncbi:unnamed protein product [Cunninghamella echinulata]